MIGSMGLEWSKLPTTHRGPPTQVGFFYFKVHSLSLCVVFIVKYCTYFSPLQVKNKPRVRVCTVRAFILGPVNVVAGNKYSVL
jgi:hypothetical protein